MPRIPEPVLARQGSLGDPSDPGRGVLPPPDRVLRWGRGLWKPLSSVMRAATSERVIALTYDDGPHPVHSPAIARALAAHDALATFFMLSDQVDRHPQVAATLLDAGHDLGLHGIDHRRLTGLPPWTAAHQVHTGWRRLRQRTGRQIRWYRPTYGSQGFTQFGAARALGMQVVHWTAWARDWVDDDVHAVADRTLAALHPGAIVLLHDDTHDTFDPALPRPTYDRATLTDLLLHGIRDRGYQVLPLGTLLARYPAVRSVVTERPRPRNREQIAQRT